eukprot:gene807-1003_t
MGNCAGKLTKKDKKKAKDQNLAPAPAAEQSKAEQPAVESSTTAAATTAPAEQRDAAAASTPATTTAEATTTKEAEQPAKPKEEEPAKPKEEPVAQPKEEQPSSSTPPTTEATKEEPTPTPTPAPSSEIKITVVSKEAGKVVKTIEVEKELHKYVIGTKGVTIKEIKESTNTTIDIPQEESDTITVTGADEADVDRALEMIKKIKGEHKTQAQKEKEYQDMRDEHEKETQRTEALYQKYQAEVDKHAQKRSELFAEAEKEYEAGNKDRARELREEAKNQTTLMEEAQNKAAREIFNDKNSKLDKFTIDLHGLQTKNALELMEERMQELQKDSSNKGKTFTIITGAGNHSDENGPKIKPLIHNTFKEKGIEFQEVNNGSISCTL